MTRHDQLSAPTAVVAAPRPELARRLDRLAWAFSALVTLVVVGLRYVSIEVPEGSTNWLPPTYSTLNALAACCLLASLYFIKQGNVRMHRNFNTLALAISALFLLGYVAYHLTTEPTRYGGVGAMRSVYLALLASHVILAAVSLPLILFAFIRAHTGLIDAHKRLVHYVYPIWLYVCITGPVCYLMLRPYYDH